MQPAVVPLQLVAGDNFDLTLRLRTKVGSSSVPLELAPGEVLGVSLDWPGNRLVSTTAPGDPSPLSLIAGPDSIELVRQFSPAETRRLLGRNVLWSLYRVPVPGQRRSYVTGPVSIIGPGQGAPGDTVLDVTVLDQSIVVDTSVPDAASYTDAREAVIRQYVQAEIADAKKFAAAAAWFMG